MTEHEIWVLLGSDARKHPAWDVFCDEMRKRQYGREPLTQAWGFFRAGWEARSRSC